jgi:regulatory protein
MVVTSIKQQVKNPDRVSISVDGKYSFSLTLGQLVEAKLRLKQDITEPRILELKKLSMHGKLLARALNWVTLRPRSEKELRMYMKRLVRTKSTESAQISEDDTLPVIDYCLQKKYVDDLRFAEWWVSRRVTAKKSTSVVKSELFMKGVAREYIDEVLKEADDEEALKNLVLKLQTRPKYQDRQRLFRYVLSKGYAYSDVLAVMAGAGE